MSFLAAIGWFSLGFGSALVLTWWAIGEMMGGVTSFWTGK
jgi:hypothetical protein